MSEFQLTTEIVALSQSQHWNTAKHEWELEEIYEVDEPDTCLCGHFPIKELCILKNAINQNHVVVGNCCVKKFIGLPSDKIFQAIKRIKKDNEKSLNKIALDYAYYKKLVNNWEYNFYLDILHKRKLSMKQLQKKIQINATVIRNM